MNTNWSAKVCNICRQIVEMAWVYRSRHSISLPRLSRHFNVICKYKILRTLLISFTLILTMRISRMWLTDIVWFIEIRFHFIFVYFCRCWYEQKNMILIKKIYGYKSQTFFFILKKLFRKKMWPIKNSCNKNVNSFFYSLLSNDKKNHFLFWVGLVCRLLTIVTGISITGRNFLLINAVTYEKEFQSIRGKAKKSWN